MVRLRMQRMGRRNRAFFRIVAAEARTPRNGRTLEILGTYDPAAETDAQKYTLKMDRVEHWLSVGAQPSETVRSIIKRVAAGDKAPATQEPAVQEPAVQEAPAQEAGGASEDA